MNKLIDEIEFTIFDTETTGLDPRTGDRIVEIAGIRFKGREKIAAFDSLINPNRPISEAAFEVNRITPKMLLGAPGIEEVLPKFLDFIQGSHLCSYNAGFDLGFLNNELKLIGKELPAQVMIIDILLMAKRLLPDLERYALWFVSEKLGIKKPQAHRALSDVELTWDVFNRLKEILAQKEITDFTNFLSLFSLNTNFLEDIFIQKISRIEEAIDLGANLRIKYLSSVKAEVSLREVVPKQIKQDKGRYYLVGHCCLRNQERSFRLDSILQIEIIDRPGLKEK